MGLSLSGHYLINMAHTASDDIPSSINSFQNKEEINICHRDDKLIIANNIRVQELQCNEDPKLVLVKNERPQKEKQISIDPISFSSIRPQPEGTLELPPPLLPAKSKFVSLPNSANTSPQYSSSALFNKQWINERQASPDRQIDDISQHMITTQKEIQLRKSKSCGEGRASGLSYDFDWQMQLESFTTKHDQKYDDHIGNLSIGMDKPIQRSSSDEDDDGFKCGALCLFLPGFGKGKVVKATRRKEQIVGQPEIERVISRTASLEKFECGSWASSAIVNDNENGEAISLYFDLPLELIKNGINDAHSPVTTAFVFGKEHLKGIHKNNSIPRKSHDQSTPRQVRFSTSSPTSYPSSPSACITPRLRKAREEFNAFLEAQSA